MFILFRSLSSGSIDLDEKGVQAQEKEEEGQENCVEKEEEREEKLLNPTQSNLT